MADKIVLDNVAGGYNLATINSNFQKVADELNDKVLYRNPPSGTSNSVEKDLDVNGKRIYNVGAPQGQNDVVRVRDLPNLTENYLPDVPTSASDISFSPYGTISSSNVQSAIQELLDEIPEIPTPTVPTASGVEFTPFGTVAATNVQDALEELITEGTGGTAPTADEVEFTPFGTVGATTVQGALEELITEGTGGSAPAASETVAGVAELATAAEVATGTDALRIVTPVRLKTQLDLKQNLITFQEDGSSLGSGVSTINFTGAGVTASKVSTTLTVNVPSGGGSGAADTSELDHVQTGTGGATLTLDDILNQDQISVKRFGATGDGVTDDYAAIQACIDYCLPRGLTVYFPPGTYISNSTLAINYSSATDDFSFKCSLKGDGPNASRIGKNAGSQNLITITGGSSAGVHSYLSVSGLYIEGHSLTGVGLAVNKVAFAAFYDVVMLGFAYGFYGTNILSSQFERCHFKFNNQGFYAERLAGGAYESDPNAITLTSCTVGNNYNYGVAIINGAVFNMFGGSVEGNGIGGAATDKFGILMNNAGVEGSVGVNLNGVYFEANKGIADIWLANSARSVAHNIAGCTFNRIDSTDFVTNNIRVETSGGQKQTVSVMGCGFKQFNTYSASSGRKYIEGVGSTNEVAWAGCYFMDASEIPSITNTIGGGGGSGVTTFNTRSGAVTLNSGDVTSALGYTPQTAGSYETANTQIVKFTDGNGIGVNTVTATLTGCPVSGTSKWIRCQNSAGADVWMLGWY